MATQVFAIEVSNKFRGIFLFINYTYKRISIYYLRSLIIICKYVERQIRGSHYCSSGVELSPLLLRPTAPAADDNG